MTEGRIAPTRQKKKKLDHTATEKRIVAIVTHKMKHKKRDKFIQPEDAAGIVSPPPDD